MTSCYVEVCGVIMKPETKKKSLNLVIKSYIHHHHLPSDGDPARATGIVRVHAAPEPDLDRHTQM